MLARLPPLLVVLAVFGAGTALAGRSLKEPPEVKSIIKRTPAASVSQALKAAGLESSCTKAALRSRELLGTTCRLAVFAHQARKRPPKSAADVKRRLKLAKAAALAATTVSEYQPLSKPPGLAEARFDAHRQACAAVRDAWDAVRGVPKSGGEALVKAAEKGMSEELVKGQTLQQVACACTAESLSLAQAADASLEITGALQGEMTSRGCGLDTSKIKATRGGPKASFSGEAKKVAAASTDEAQLLSYAKTRDIGLDRCRDNFLKTGRLKEPKKMKKCACSEIGRWGFPKKRGRKDLSVTIPIYKDQLGVEVTVTAPGKVASCGPLAGPMLKQ